MAQAMRMPKIAPEAPIVGISETGWPQKRGKDLTMTLRTSEPTQVKK
jgi:hypothetical protein